MFEALRRAPKAELHLHLEGAVRPATLLEIAPTLTREEIEERYRFTDFQSFLKTYGWVTGFLNGPRAYAMAARRLFEELQAQNVTYAEINLSVGVMLWRNLDAAAIFDALEEEAARAALQVVWIFDAVRQWPVEDAWRVARLAAGRVHRGVLGFGIGGDEARGPAELFTEVFSFARDAGLALVPHAGETTDARSIWAVLERGACRIGHGIRAVDDPALLDHLRRSSIPLEICLSSNVATGAAASWDRHPLRTIFDAGVPVTLSTDDPALFDTTLEQEYERARTHFGFSFEELEAVRQDAFRFALRKTEAAGISRAKGK
ncbi:MAG TPA: adenosine deaminase [Solibacterales bacterium]|nr:adenosine deaminase [Bryobacterales bacterium]